jgi:hypothetical protein
VFVRLLIAAVLAALVVPGVAKAHHTAVPVVALDYRNHVVAASEAAGVRASVEDAGRKLRLTVKPGQTVVVAGYEGEPFLRFDRSGVAANSASKTALALRLVRGTPATSWVPVSSGHSFVWADARAWAPSAALHGRQLVRWSVPIVVDGRHTAIRGELTRAAKPTLWPWLVLAALPLLAAVVAVRRRRWLWAGATGLAALAGLTTLANLAGFATGGLSVSADRWVLLAVEVGLTVVALGCLLQSRARLIAVAALASFAVLQALSELAVFRHGVVVSGLPAAAVRAAAALALGAGLGAAVLVFLVPTPQTRKRVTHVRIPRKEQA